MPCRHLVVISTDSNLLDRLDTSVAGARYTLHDVVDIHAPATLPFLHNADAVLVDCEPHILAGADDLARLLRVARRPYFLLRRAAAAGSEDRALRAGAFGSLDWPLHIEELIVRLDILWRARAEDVAHSSLFIARNVMVDSEASMIACHGHVIDLTQQEGVLLRSFLKFRDRIVTQYSLCELLGVPADPHGRSVVRQSVARLRHKLGSDPTSSFVLRTEGHRGYRLLVG